MLKKIPVQFKGEKINAVFNLNTYMKFGRSLGLKKVNELTPVFTEMFSNPTGNLDDFTFDQLNNFAEFLLIALTEGARIEGKEFTATVEDIFDAFADDDTLVSSMVQEIASRTDDDVEQSDGDDDDTGSKKKMRD